MIKLNGRDLLKRQINGRMLLVLLYKRGISTESATLGRVINFLTDAMPYLGTL